MQSGQEFSFPSEVKIKAFSPLIPEHLILLITSFSSTISYLAFYHSINEHQIHKVTVTTGCYQFT
jgi:hypothetical protein